MHLGFLDSGVGGLTVLENFLKVGTHNPEPSIAPQITYLADFANLPYGNKDIPELKNILIKNLEWFVSAGASDVILACNTSSALFEGEVADRFSGRLKVLGLIQNTALALAKSDFDSLTGVSIFCTQATHSTGAYISALKRLRPKLVVNSVPCPELVKFIEANLHLISSPGFNELAEPVLRQYIDRIPAEEDALILGCTHYPMLRRCIQRMRPNLFIIDPGELLATSKLFGFSLKSPIEVVSTAQNASELNSKLDHLVHELSYIHNCGFTCRAQTALV